MDCSRCGFSNPSGFKFCGSCGDRLNRICPNCNNEDLQRARFCSRCGSTLGNFCPGCGHDNPQSARFCSECGLQLDKVCPECNTVNPLYARFCNICGKNLPETDVAVPHPGWKPVLHPISKSSVSRAVPYPTVQSQEKTAIESPHPVPVQETSHPDWKPPQPDYAEQLQKFIPPALRDMYLDSRGSIEGEKKIVNMIFSDVSGFTALSEKYAGEPEEIHRIINECLRRQAEQVYALEGYVDKFIGDELVALFGAPVWHEDDAHRSVTAALKMRDAVGKYSDELEREKGVRLHVHIGINTGRVSVGGIGDDMFMNYTVMGDPVNLASRMEDIAEAGEVIVGELTYRLTKALFDYEEPRYERVKGRAEPQPVYELIGPKEHPESERGIEGLTSEMIGRQVELEALRSYAEKAFASTAQVVSIIGEAGLGKSRLKQELKAELGDSVVWVEGHCSELTQHTAYSVFLDAIKSQFGVGAMDTEGWMMIGEILVERSVISKDQLETALELQKHEKKYQRKKLGEILVDLEYADEESIASCYTLQLGMPHIRAKITKGVCQLFDEEDSISPTEDILPYLFQLMSIKPDREIEEKIKYMLDDPEHLHRQTFLAISNLLTRIGKEKPLVLALEDLHWADDLSLKLITFLIENVKEFGGLILCIYRPESHSACQQMSAAARERLPDSYGEVTLDRLSDGDMELLLDSLLPLEESEDSCDLKEMILQKAEGNPFYLEEVIRTLLEDKAIEGTADGAKYVIVQKLEDIDVPAGVESIVRARIDRLTELKDGSKQTLMRASVIGRVFDRRILEDISPEHVNLGRHLDRLIAMELIAPSGRFWLEQEYSFRHILTRRIAYDSVIARERRKLHGQIADCMEELYPERLYPDRLEYIVGHYRLSDNHNKAVVYLIKAGQKARRLYNNAAAINYYTDALDFLSNHEMPDKDERHEKIYEGLGDIYRVTSRFDEALQSYGEAGDFCSIPESKAAIYRKMGDIYEKKADYDASKEQYGLGLAELRHHPGSVELPKLYSGIGFIHYRRGEYSEAIDMCERALEMLHHKDDRVTSAETYKNLAIAKLFMGNAEEAFANMDLSVETAEKTNDRMLLARLYNTKAGIYQWSGNLDDTIETFQRVMEMRTQLGDIDGQATTENSLGIAYTTKGEYSKAIECLKDSLELAQRVGNARLIADSYMNLGVVYRYMKEPDRAIECYQKCREAYRNMNINFPRAIALCIGNIADAYKEKGDLEEAEKHHLEAIGMARQIGDREVECYQYHGLSEIYLAREDYPSVLENSERAMVLAEELNDQETMGDVCKCICEVYRRMSRREKALSYLGQANDHYAEIGAEAKLKELQKLKAKLTQEQSA